MPDDKKSGERRTREAFALARKTLARSKGGRVPPTDELVVLDREPGKFLFAYWQNVIILAWAAQGDLRAVARLRRVLSDVAGTWAGGRSTVSIIAEGLAPPTEEARAQLIEIMNANPADVACVAVVVQGTGFRSSVLKSAHTSMRMESSRTYEMGLLNSVEELEEWLPPRHAKTGVTLDPRELGKIVRRAFEEAAARDPGPR